MNYPVVLGILGFLAGLSVMIAPQHIRWSVGIWLVLYGLFSFIPK